MKGGGGGGKGAAALTNLLPQEQSNRAKLIFSKSPLSLEHKNYLMHLFCVKSNLKGSAHETFDQREYLNLLDHKAILCHNKNQRLGRI